MYGVIFNNQSSVYNTIHEFLEFSKNGTKNFHFIFLFLFSLLVQYIHLSVPKNVSVILYKCVK